MAVSIITPSRVARQSTLSAFQSQQLVFIISIATLLVGILVGGLALRRETNRRFHIEEALRKSETEQAILTERNRLASDLHDSVTQGLYGILLHADAARGQLAARHTEKAAEYLEEIKAAGKEGLAEMRLLIFELRSPVLEEEGLVSALEARLFGVEKRAGLKVDFSSDIGSRLPLDIEEGLYRIAQEALNNMLKHAQAQQVQVNLKQVEGAITLEIEDDGSGFDVETARRAGGMGIANMEERAEKLNSRLSIRSEPGRGTRIMVEVNP
jgi:signal transduction histidine kinase